MLDKVKKNPPRFAFGLALLLFLIIALVLRKQLYCVVREPVNQNSFTLLVFLIPLVAGFVGGELLPRLKAVLRAIVCAVGAALLAIIVLNLICPPRHVADCYAPTPTATHTPTPTPTPTATPTHTSAPFCVLVADFDDNDDENRVNALGGDMGSSHDGEPGDSFDVYYVPAEGRGKVVRLEYVLEYWGAFWLKLNQADLTPYSRVVFAVRADPSPEAPGKIKLELWRDCFPTGKGETDCYEWEVAYSQGISESWQTVSVPFDEFVGTGFEGKRDISDWGDIEQLVFTIERLDVSREKTGFGEDGALLLDNIKICE